MDYEINRNIIKLIERLGITPYDFSKKIGNKRPDNVYNVINCKVKVSPKTLDKIITTFPEYKQLIITGDGEMLKTPSAADVQSDSGAYLIPMLPIAAQGGSLNDFIVSVKSDDCEKIVSPIKGVDFAMSVSGDSMEPEFPSGSKILIKKINEKAFIEWGRVYVLDTCNGSVVKKILPGEDGVSVVCESINPKYPPFKVDFADIYGMYRVLMLLSEK